MICTMLIFVLISLFHCDLLTIPEVKISESKSNSHVNSSSSMKSQVKPLSNSEISAIATAKNTNVNHDYMSNISDSVKVNQLEPQQKTSTDLVLYDPNQNVLLSPTPPKAFTLSAPLQIKPLPSSTRFSGSISKLGVKILDKSEIKEFVSPIDVASKLVVLDVATRDKIKNDLEAMNESLSSLSIDNLDVDNQNKIKDLKTAIVNHASSLCDDAQAQLIVHQKESSPNFSSMNVLKGAIKKYYQKMADNMTPVQLKNALVEQSQIAKDLNSLMTPIKNERAPMDAIQAALTTQKTAIDIELKVLRKDSKDNPLDLTKKALLDQKSLEAKQLLEKIKQVKQDLLPFDKELQPLKDQSELVTSKIEILQGSAPSRSLLSEVGANNTQLKKVDAPKKVDDKAKLQNLLSASVMPKVEIDALKATDARGYLLQAKQTLNATILKQKEIAESDDALFVNSEQKQKMLEKMEIQQKNLESNIALLNKRLESQKSINVDKAESVKTSIFAPKLISRAPRNQEISQKSEVSYVFSDDVAGRVAKQKAQNEVQSAALDAARLEVESNAMAQFESQLPAWKLEYLKENQEYAHEKDFDTLMNRAIEVDKNQMIKLAIKNDAESIVKAGNDAVAQFQSKVAAAAKDQGVMNSVVAKKSGGDAKYQQSLEKRNAIDAQKYLIDKQVEQSFDAIAWKRSYVRLHPESKYNAEDFFKTKMNEDIAEMKRKAYETPENKAAIEKAGNDAVAAWNAKQSSVVA